MRKIVIATLVLVSLGLIGGTAYATGGQHTGGATDAPPPPPP